MHIMRCNSDHQYLNSYTHSAYVTADTEYKHVATIKYPFLFSSEASLRNAQSSFGGFHGLQFGLSVVEVFIL